MRTPRSPRRAASGATAALLALLLFPAAPARAVLDPVDLPEVSAFARLRAKAFDRSASPRVKSLAERIRARATALYGMDLSRVDHVALVFKGASSARCALTVTGDGIGARDLEGLFAKIFGGTPRTARAGDLDVVFHPGVLSGVAEPGAFLVAPDESAAAFAAGPGAPLSGSAEHAACVEPLQGSAPDFLLYAVANTWLAGRLERYLGVPEAMNGVRATALALAGETLALSFALEREADPDALGEALRVKREEDATLASALSLDGLSTRETALYVRFRVAPSALEAVTAECARAILDHLPEDKRTETEILACAKRTGDLKLLIAAGKFDPALLNRTPERSCPHGGVLVEREGPEGIRVDCTRHGFNLE